VSQAPYRGGQALAMRSHWTIFPRLKRNKEIRADEFRGISNSWNKKGNNLTIRKYCDVPESTVVEQSSGNLEDLTSNPGDAPDLLLVKNK